MRVEKIRTEDISLLKLRLEVKRLIAEEKELDALMRLIALLSIQAQMKQSIEELTELTSIMMQGVSSMVITITAATTTGRDEAHERARMGIDAVCRDLTDMVMREFP